ncbi:MBL fold metallo-hydrolase [Lacibacter luteus]|uniref:MBL fold metallo-hydrolase n=1 Tax=Lacibacter luteus TaxID=2508719 RepID=A0A4Q1CIC4_9BACT|nr:MBL fold metallo-hydrolase [Lacibacter luteus]RXK59809.1 MBL fold metallo-hydrolase [Lacibacter luteus]
MFIQQLYTNCLSEAAYYIESEGECAIIDPMRDVDTYINLAKERKATIKYIFETHIHADFVSGHLDLAKATNAPIVYGPDASTAFSIYVAKDHEQFKIGNLTLEVLHTPGHTMESSCFLLKDEEGKAHCVFTGDTLFVGDVGRPDLAQGGEVTKDELAGNLYHSLQEKIVPLADDVIVYPAHGPGSSCGKSLGPDTHSTIGEQKKTNYALQQQSKEQFIKAITEGLEAPPKYFPVNARINKEGYGSLQTVLEKGMTALTIEEFKNLIKEPNTFLLDTRPSSLFTFGFVPGSVSIGLEGRFAEWAGALLSFDENIVLVCEQGKEEESITRLARVGFEKISGHLAGGFEAWQQAGEEIDMIIDVEADELAMDLPHDDNLVVVDVRKETEFAEGHLKDAVNLPLAEMNDPGLIANIEDRDNLYVHCAGGYRSVIASSILKKQGFHNLRNVVGGFDKIKEQKIEIVKEKSVLN